MSVRTLTAIYSIMTIVIMAIAIMLMTVVPAPAEYAPSYRSRDSYTWSWWGSTACEECRRRQAAIRRARERRAYWHRKHQEDAYERRTYKLYRESHDDDDDGRHRHCQPRLAAVGDQYASENGAQEEANKAWMQTARWQYGERYMAREHAKDAAYECGRSSVGSVVGQVFYRCRLTARPCSATKTRGN